MEYKQINPVWESAHKKPSAECACARCEACTWLAAPGLVGQCAITGQPSWTPARKILSRRSKGGHDRVIGRKEITVCLGAGDDVSKLREQVSPPCRQCDGALIYKLGHAAVCHCLKMYGDVANIDECDGSPQEEHHVDRAKLPPDVGICRECEGAIIYNMRGEWHVFCAKVLHGEPDHKVTDCNAVHPPEWARC